MKILLISVDFPPHQDGVSAVSLHYAKGLAERGHAVCIVGPRAADDDACDAAMPFHSFRFPGYGLGLLRFFPFVLWSLRAVLHHRPDLIFAMNIGYGGVLCYLLSFVSRCRYVTMAYAYEFLKFRDRPLLKRFYNAIYRRSVMTIAISRFTRDRLVDFGVAPSGIKLVYPGVAPGEGPDVPQSKGRADAAPGLTIGTCGRLIRRKGHDLVIRALPPLIEKHPALRYRIAGRGPAEADLRRLAAELGVEANVEFLGQIPRGELPAFYRSLDLFVMPSRDESSSGHAEGYGIVFLEAALEGVPSLASRTGGIPEAVLDAETGVLAGSATVEAVSAALGDLLARPDRMRRMGEAARERAAGECCWESRIDELANFLEDA